MAFARDSRESTEPCAAADSSASIDCAPQETIVLARPAEVKDKNLRLLTRIGKFSVFRNTPSAE